MGTTGLPADWTLKGELPSLPPVDPSLEAITATALERRLDVQAAKRAAEARLARLSVTRGTRLTPHLQAGVSTESNHDGTRVTGPQAALELPLFSAGQAAIAAADSQARLAMREAESLALDARRDVRLAWAEMLEARRRHLALAGEAVPARERIVEGAQGEFAFMLKGAFDPLRSQEQLIEARESATAALADYLVARVALARAAGDLEALGGSRP
jgi:outer membrane protein TolC